MATSQTRRQARNHAGEQVPREWTRVHRGPAPRVPVGALPCRGRRLSSLDGSPQVTAGPSPPSRPSCGCDPDTAQGSSDGPLGLAELGRPRAAEAHRRGRHGGGAPQAGVHSAVRGRGESRAGGSVETGGWGGAFAACGRVFTPHSPTGPAVPWTLQLRVTPPGGDKASSCPSGNRSSATQAPAGSPAGDKPPWQAGVGGSSPPARAG